MSQWICARVRYGTLTHAIIDRPQDRERRILLHGVPLCDIDAYRGSWVSGFFPLPNRKEPAEFSADTPNVCARCASKFRKIGTAS